MDIFAKLKELDFPPGEYVVVGGSMLAHGIREARDLDILVTPKLYQQLLQQGWEQCRCDKCLERSTLMLKREGVDILPNLTLGDYTGDIMKLIREADIIGGYPFIKLTEFIDFKKQLGRPKDVADIRLMEEYLKKNNNTI